MMIFSIPNISRVKFCNILYLSPTNHQPTEVFFALLKSPKGEKYETKLTFSMTIGSLGYPHFTKRKPHHFSNGIEGGYN